MSEREKLIKELERNKGSWIGFTSDWLADFILEDRKRICAPLIKLNVSRDNPIWSKGGIAIEDLCKGIEDALKLANLGE